MRCFTADVAVSFVTHYVVCSTAMTLAATVEVTLGCVVAVAETKTVAVTVPLSQ